MPARLCLPALVTPAPSAPSQKRESQSKTLQVSKDYDFTAKQYICPKPQASTATDASGAAPGPAAAGGSTVPGTSDTQPLTVELDVTGEIGAAAWGGLRGAAARAGQRHCSWPRSHGMKEPRALPHAQSSSYCSQPPDFLPPSLP